MFRQVFRLTPPRLAFPSHRRQWLKYQTRVYGVYGSGSARDLHPVPFSGIISDETIHTKTCGKGKEYL